MAKKKEKKEKEKKFQYSNEIIGIFFILIAIVGICGFGRAGDFVKSFSVFLVGNGFLFLLAILLIIGCYLIIKRDNPNFFSIKAIGFYIIAASFLILFHNTYISEIKVNNFSDFNIIKETWDNVILGFNSPTTSVIENCGGGMIGAVLSWFFGFLFGDGIFIVVGTLIVLGILLLFNVSIAELIKRLNIKFKLPKFIRKKEEQEVEEDKRIIISSMDELTHIKNPEPEVDNCDVPIKDNYDINDENYVNANYKLPPLTLLKSVKNKDNKENVDAVKANIEILEKVLTDFEITGRIIECHIGPSVTQYELEIKQGTKVSKLLSIQREIALALAAKEVRIQAPIPGKNTIGIEIPNKNNTSVSFKEVLSCLPPINGKTLLAVGLGKDIMGRVKWAEINATPHLLIAGATGSGKSVCVNCIVASLLMRTRPDEVKLVMIDPKKVELTMYNGVPHLLDSVVTDPKKASIALKNIVNIMEKRYAAFEQHKCKNIVAYNELCDRQTSLQKMPYIVVIIDELADLMVVAAKEVEDSIMRIASMARAAGIHLIVSTQRPSTDVITGVVKANIPSRLSFAVSSNVDSRTILDMSGAEKLLGKGDMLFLPMGENIPLRIQGAYISDEELEGIVKYVSNQQKVKYDPSLTQDSKGRENFNNDFSNDEEYEDPLYDEVVDFAVHTGKISASLIQRKYRLGYNRAARIIDLLEERGIVGPQNGSKPRDVLVKLEDDNED